VQRREVAAQLGGHGLLPALLGQLADVALGADAAEDRFGGLRGTDRFLLPSRFAKQQGQVASGIGLQLDTPMELRASHDFTERLLGAGHLTFGRQNQRGHAEILGFADGVGQTAADLADAVELTACELGLTAHDANFRAATQRYCE